MSDARVATAAEWTPQYERWRHGGWYVTNVHYPSGAVGCVSNNYEDRRWRITSDPSRTTFPSRDTAARAERVVAAMLANTPSGCLPEPDRPRRPTHANPTGWP